MRRRIVLHGQVQGVGLRPAIYRLAAAHGLGGFVANDVAGAVIEVEGPAAVVAAFGAALRGALPPLALVRDQSTVDLAPLGESTFRIVASRADPARPGGVTPDAATCPDCLRELLDPRDRRYRYPFINCTNCGPRYSIIRDVPYDRPRTTMAPFVMCAACQREYDDPADRRFHAQPNACPACGPRLMLQRPGAAGAAALENDALRTAAALLRDGAIVAVKGIGGFHLACRADDERAVATLRERKLRDGKPLAVMAADVATVRRYAEVSSAAEAALRAPAAPIVLLPCGAERLAPGVAPGCAQYGFMLAYSPVHHLLFTEGLGPLVMTSANLSGEPLTYRDEDALEQLHDVASAFLLHDRAIVRPVDDSVVATFRGALLPVRRARGYAPAALRIAFAGPQAPRPDVLAVGGELKAAVCLWREGEAIVSEHLGDLGNPAALRHYFAAVERLCALFAFRPEVVACDAHPQYAASTYARALGLPLVAVQHHHAHVASVLAEHGFDGPVIGLACDGTGYGDDGAVWGGEVLACSGPEYTRVGHIRYFALSGGDAAALETWRPAAALLWAACGTESAVLLERVGERFWPDGVGGAFRSTIRELGRAAESGAAEPAWWSAAPRSSSLGRIFDAAAFVLGACAYNRHEAEGAMAVESLAADLPDAPPLAWELDDRDGMLTLGFAPTIHDLAQLVRAGSDRAELAARFHATIALGLAETARRAAHHAAIDTIALSGGCFVNRLLLDAVVKHVEAAGYRVMWPQAVPAGDGGLALGQAAVAAWRAGSQRKQ